MEITFTENKNKWMENFARFGYGAKGIVFCLLGFLALTAALGNGSSKNTSKSDVFNLVLELPFGKVILAIIALGLLGFVFWRGVETFKDPHNKGNNFKGILTRIGYGLSGLIYLALSYLAVKMVFTDQSSGGENGKKQQLLSNIFEFSWGKWLIGLIALGIIAKGIQQIYKSISGKYKKELEENKIHTKYKNLLVKAGAVGYIARGIVLGIIGYLLLRASLNANSKESAGTEDALTFLDNSFGSYIFGLIALGLICYGIFKILEAFYRRIVVE